MLASRLRMIAEYVRERRRFGTPALTGDPGNGTVFLLDGVGGFLMAPVLARKAFREAGLPYATYVFDWNHGRRGDLLGDLIGRRRNQLEAMKLARLIRRFRRANPAAPLHVLAYSGGTGVAVFAAERLRGRARIDTLVLCCPALSPEYPLDLALQSVERCFVFASRRDRVMLGLGTRLFGTIDRRFTSAAGFVGFRSLEPGGRSPGPFDDRVRQIWWSREMRRYGHFGHHVGCATTAFIRHQIAPLLLGP